MSQTLALSSTPTKDNSPVSEVAYSVESGGDGVYSVSMLARYSAEGEPLNTTQKELISQLSHAIESKSVFISERGLTSSQWTEYSEHTKRVQYSTVSTSSITAEAVMVDGFALSQKDGTWYTYGWDLTKNICEVYSNNGTLGTSYTYTPYGQVSVSGGIAQNIQWSSEFNDTELGLTYYNYRHYNPVDVYGCHLSGVRGGKLAHTQVVEMVIARLKKLKKKKCCMHPERIQIVSATLSSSVVVYK